MADSTIATARLTSITKFSELSAEIYALPVENESNCFEMHVVIDVIDSPEIQYTYVQMVQHAINTSLYS